MSSGSSGSNWDVICDTRCRDRGELTASDRESSDRATDACSRRINKIGTGKSSVSVKGNASSARYIESANSIKEKADSIPTPTNDRFVAMDRNDFSHMNDSQFESVRKMAGIFGMEALQSLVVLTPAEQLERVNAFDAYEQGLIAHVRENLQAPAAEAIRLTRSQYG
ncbi:hypothetical protein PInf_004352 [Phytophthora infestans]|nr:hypothetical protein PInf_004352 [Phytophthora infestans]